MALMMMEDFEGQNSCRRSDACDIFTYLKGSTTIDDK